LEEASVVARTNTPDERKAPGLFNFTRMHAKAEEETLSEPFSPYPAQSFFYYSTLSHVPL
jgi:hypothetical protein